MVLRRPIPANTSDHPTTPARVRSWAANMTLMALGLLVAPIALSALILVLGEMGLRLGRQAAERLGGWIARRQGDDEP